MEDKKRSRGKPLIYTNPKDMQRDIDKYFESCWAPIRNKAGEILTDEYDNPIKEQVRPYTICGLALALGMTRQSLLNYAQKDEYFDTVTRAKLICQDYAEQRLFDRDGANGAKFTLAVNYGWVERTAIEIGNLDDKPFTVADMSLEDKLAAIARIKSGEADDGSDEP